MDVSQYLDIFIDETKEHLQNLNTRILELEQDGESSETVNEIFRAAHSLKGMAGTMGYKRMQKLTHDMENVFSEVRNGNLKVNETIIDLLFKCLDALEEYLSCIQETADEGTNDNEHLIKGLNDFLSSQNGEEVKQEPSVKVEVKAEVKAEPKPVVNEKEALWAKIKIDESSQTVISEAAKMNVNAYGVTIYIQESCLLKAARAFLVYKALEELGDIIISVPSSQDIEDEKFENDFSVIFLSEHPLEKVLDAVKNVSEIEDAVGGNVVVEKSSDSTEIVAADDLKETESVKEENQPAVKTPSTGTEKKINTKPIVNRTVRVDIEKLDQLMNLVSELIISKNSLVSVAGNAIGSGNLAFNEQIEYLESVTTNLHESVMKVRMVPIENTVNKFPRMIRDLSKKLNKKMELYMTGEETELDRTVVDEIGDPLMHLLRNSADHGIESEDVRISRGKPETGSIFLDAYQDGNNVVIEVRDDGNGIDVEAVKQSAVEKGKITPEMAEVMSDKDAIDLLFQPSFSTAKTVSDISGRGVGLDVVKSKIEALSGEIEVKTVLHEGSTFIVRLPLTLAIIQAIMVRVGTEKYAISLGVIQTIESIDKKEIKKVQGKEVINLRGNVIPIIRLNEVLDIEATSTDNPEMLVLIAKKGDRFAGIVVDELLGQMEIVIKSLGKFAGKSKLISGATILGDGEVALILDANTLI